MLGIKLGKFRVEIYAESLENGKTFKSTKN